MSFRRAKSLDKLLEQINNAFPGRDKTSDGWIGDAAHASRNSDHNPWVHDGKMGVVTAIDIDEDLNANGTLEKVITAIRASRDKRVKYIIYEGRITVQGSDLQRWKKYTGKNLHKQHAHISVHSDRKLYDSTADWDIGIKKTAAAEKPAEILPVAEPVKTPDVAANEPTVSQPPPASLVPVITPVVEVEQVTAEKEAEKEVSGIQASTAGAATFITTTLGGVIAFLSDKGWQIVVGVAIVGAAFFLARFWYANREKQRMANERQEREKRAHEIQMVTLKSAMDPALNTVRVIPQPIENSDTSV